MGATGKRDRDIQREMGDIRKSDRDRHTDRWGILGREKETDRQTDRHWGRETETYREMGTLRRERQRLTYREVGDHGERKRDRQTNTGKRDTDRETRGH